MAGRIILVATLLVLLTTFHQDSALLHKTTAAARVSIDTETSSPRFGGVGPEPQISPVLQGITEEIDKPVAQSCYAFMRRRPPQSTSRRGAGAPQACRSNDNRF